MIRGVMDSMSPLWVSGFGNEVVGESLQPRFDRMSPLDLVHSLGPNGFGNLCLSLCTARD